MHDPGKVRAGSIARSGAKIDRYPKGVPAPFGALIATKTREAVLIGYLLGAALMLFAGIVEALFGVAAEGKSLESVAAPLSSKD
ncbi:MAG: hypothetical protein WCF20_14920 [Methylovirgula sp.]